jgi:hypothetical protein
LFWGKGMVSWMKRERERKTGQKQKTEQTYQLTAAGELLPTVIDPCQSNMVQNSKPISAVRVVA